VKILGYLGRGSGEQNANNVGKLSRLISFCMYGIFIFYNIYNRLTTGDLLSHMQMSPNVLQDVQGGLW
jgi:hypothetical protein